MNEINQIKPQDFDCLVYSTAIDINKHPIALLFKQKQILFSHRSEILHWAFSQTKSISVSGTHGKTTTTGMIAFILQKLGKQPKVMIGAEASFLDHKGGDWGSGDWGVYESDESDGTFLKHNANIKVITNLDEDHLDFYQTKENLEQAFIQFINQNSKSQIILNLTDKGLQKIQPYLKNPNITSFQDTKQSNVLFYEIKNNVLFFKENHKVHQLKLKVGGSHYLQNALCAVLALKKIGISIEDSLSVLHQYPSVKRRLQFLGEKNQIQIFDDYAHHPTEIKSVLQAFQHRKRRLVVLFQPHRYTRTQLFYKQFAESLSSCDFLFLLPIYSAGENPINGVDETVISKFLSCKFQKLSGSLQFDTSTIENVLQAGDDFVCLGAGNVYLWGEKILSS